MKGTLHARALQRAAELKGGAKPLALHLGVSESRLALWLDAKATLPPQVFDKVLDVLLDADVAALKAGAPVRVLVVDDDASGAYGLARIVRQLGYSVEIAGSGEAGLEMARRLRPEVVFVDLRMPGIDGVELAGKLRAEGLGTHVIAATAYRSELEHARTVGARFDAHFIKPIDQRALEGLLAALH